MRMCGPPAVRDGDDPPAPEHYAAGCAQHALAWPRGAPAVTPPASGAVHRAHGGESIPPDVAVVAHVARRRLSAEPPIGDDRAMRLSRVPFPAVAAAAVSLAFPIAGRAADRATAADVQRGLDGLVAAGGGPPGAVATLYRNGR